MLINAVTISVIINVTTIQIATTAPVESLLESFDELTLTPTIAYQRNFLIYTYIFLLGRYHT